MDLIDTTGNPVVLPAEPDAPGGQNAVAYVLAEAHRVEQCEMYARFRGWQPEQFGLDEPSEALFTDLDMAGSGGLIVWEADCLGGPNDFLSAADRAKQHGWGLVVASLGLDTSLPAGAAALKTFADVASEKGGFTGVCPPGMKDYVASKRREGWPWWRIVSCVNTLFPAPISGKWTQSNVQAAVGRSVMSPRRPGMFPPSTERS